MIISFKWLKELLPINCSAQELADHLTLAGIEVESVTEVGDTLSHIITGKIESISPHPNADKLVKTVIFDGENRHDIVTGATNIKENQIVPVALPGATLANKLKIKPSKLRGEPSNGMLCSEKELGISDEATGIWILPNTTPIGLDFIETGHLKDTLIDIAVLPNRSDCQSMVGIAREISAILSLPLPTPPEIISSSPQPTNIKCQIDAPTLCPLYTAQKISGLSQNKTPIWMQRKLALMGIRPINLIVDITNYVLLETGHPLHAFDAHKITNNVIEIRQSKNKESLTTLDGKTHTLPNNTLLICNNDTPIAIAGIMGGKSTEVDTTTTDIILEAAYFDPTQIRRSQQQLGVRTDSAIRFEKGVDWHTVTWASQRAAYLYQTLANGQCHTIVTTDNIAKSQVPHTESLPFDLQKVNALLGTTISSNAATNYLDRLGYAFNKNQLIIPSWRQRDIHGLSEVAEEIARIHQYTNIPAALPQQHINIDPTPSHTKCIQSLKAHCIHFGLNEVQTFPMICPTDCESLQIPKGLMLQNPLTPTESMLRPLLLPALLKVVQLNQNRQNTPTNIFEIATTFPLNQAETLECAGILSSNNHPHAPQDTESNPTFFDLKGFVTSYLNKLNITHIDVQASTSPFLHPKESCQFISNKHLIGEVGMLHPLILDQLNIKGPLGYFRLMIQALTDSQKKAPTQYQAFSKYPTIRRDVALLVPKTLSYAALTDTIRKYQPKLCKNTQLFDYFEDEKAIGADHISIAFACFYQSYEKTLVDEDINPIHTKFCKKIVTDLPVSFR